MAAGFMTGIAGCWYNRDKCGEEVDYWSAGGGVAICFCCVTHFRVLNIGSRWRNNYLWRILFNKSMNIMLFELDLFS